MKGVSKFISINTKSFNKSIVYIYIQYILITIQYKYNIDSIVNIYTGINNNNINCTITTYST